MQTGDWLGAGLNVLTGVLLGLAVNGVVQLVAGGAWLLAVLAVLAGAGAALFVFVADGLFSGLIDRIFPGGVMPAQRSQADSRKPLARLLSLPLGIGLGVILAQLGLTRTILGLF